MKTIVFNRYRKQKKTSINCFFFLAYITRSSKKILEKKRTRLVFLQSIIFNNENENQTYRRIALY